MDPDDRKVNIDMREQVALTSRPRRKRRPNASGFAKADCHTCVQEGKSCDRSLPKCQTCLESDEVCGGYVVALKWGSTLVTQVKIESTEAEPDLDSGKAKEPRNTGKSESSQGPQKKEIKFKVGKPKKSRFKPKDHVEDEAQRGSKQVALRKRPSFNGNELVPMQQHSRRINSSPVSSRVAPSRSPSPLLPLSSVEYSSLAHKMSGVLEMCKYLFSPNYW